MTTTDDTVLSEPPVAGSEIDTLIGSLERQRRTLEWKCSGLDAAGTRATVGTSTVTLGGLLKHLAVVEDDMFGQKLLGRPPAGPWAAVDRYADPEWEWRTAADDSPEELLTLWRDAAGRSRTAVREALVAAGPEQIARYTNARGESPSLRRLLVDMIEEYARHVGHADLIRESVDGLVGEDPPR